MVRIRPGLEIVWRSTTTLQVGVPEPLAIVENATDGIDWLIARLRSGTTTKAALAAAVRHGSTMEAATTALDALRGVLVPVAPSGRMIAEPGGRTVALRTAHRDVTDEKFVCVAAAMADRGVDVRAIATDELPNDGEVLVELADFVVPPSRVQPLMAADVPHLAIVVGDHAIEVSPLVIPGETPCLRCGELRRRDADLAWPLIAAQLAGRVARHHCPVELGLAAGLAARALRRTAPPIDYRIDLVTAAVSTRQRLFHAECGCQGLPETAMAPGADHARPRARNSAPVVGAHG